MINLIKAYSRGRVKMDSMTRIAVVNDLKLVSRGFDPVQAGERCGIPVRDVAMPRIIATMTEPLRSGAPLTTVGSARA